MSKVAIQGAATGTGVFTLASPATNTNRTLTIPDVDGTIVTADASGNVGIGTSSPSYKLDVVQASAGSAVRIWDNTDSSPEPTLYLQRGTNATWGADAYTDYKLMATAGTFTISGGESGVTTERIRIDNSGNLLVGTTGLGLTNERLSVWASGSTANAALFRFSTTDDRAVTVFWHLGATGATSRKMASFLNSGGSEVGYISSTGSTTSYVTSSDYRLKEDLVAVADASTRVNALKPVNFAWKVDGSRVDGFLAHELAEVVPEAVTGTKDATEIIDIKDEDGNVTGQEERPVYQGIDQSKLVPLLTAALQEALTRIETLEADVATLKGNA